MAELPFPSVTICSPGLDMEAVKEAILDDFNVWLNKGKSEGDYQELLDQFVEEKYGRKVTEENILAKIKALNLPPSESTEIDRRNKILQNMALCRKLQNRESAVSRWKRSGQGNHFDSWLIYSCLQIAISTMIPLALLAVAIYTAQ